MEVLKGAFYSIGSKPTGSIILGATSGIIAYKAGVTNKFALAAIVFGWALIGSAIEYDLTEPKLK